MYYHNNETLLQYNDPPIGASLALFKEQPQKLWLSLATLSRYA